jgi:hypothetical protein
VSKLEILLSFNDDIVIKAAEYLFALGKSYVLNLFKIYSIIYVKECISYECKDTFIKYLEGQVILMTFFGEIFQHNHMILT